MKPAGGSLGIGSACSLPSARGVTVLRDLARNSYAGRGGTSEFGVAESRRPKEMVPGELHSGFHLVDQRSLVSLFCSD